PRRGGRASTGLPPGRLCPEAWPVIPRVAEVRRMDASPKAMAADDQGEYEGAVKQPWRVLAAHRIAPPSDSLATCKHGLAGTAADRANDGVFHGLFHDGCPP